MAVSAAKMQGYRIIESFAQRLDDAIATKDEAGFKQIVNEWADKMKESYGRTSKTLEEFTASKTFAKVSDAIRKGNRLFNREVSKTQRFWFNAALGAQSVVPFVLLGKIYPAAAGALGITVGSLCQAQGKSVALKAEAQHWDQLRREGARKKSPELLNAAKEKGFKALGNFDPDAIATGLAVGTLAACASAPASVAIGLGGLAAGTLSIWKPNYISRNAIPGLSGAISLAIPFMNICLIAVEGVRFASSTRQ